MMSIHTWLTLFVMAYILTQYNYYYHMKILP